MVENKDEKFTNVRKISFQGSSKWYFRVSNLHVLIK